MKEIIRKTGRVITGSTIIGSIGYAVYLFLSAI